MQIPKLVPKLSKDQARQMEQAKAEYRRRLDSYHADAANFCRLVGLNPNERCKTAEKMPYWEAAATFMDGVYCRFVKEEQVRLAKEADKELQEMQKEAIGIMATKVIAMSAWILMDGYQFDEEWAGWYIRDALSEAVRTDRNMKWYTDTLAKAGVDLPLTHRKVLNEDRFRGSAHAMDSEIEEEEEQ